MTVPTAPTIADFLLDRIAEDEAPAREVMGGPWHSCARSPVEVHQYENGRHFCEHWRATAMTMNECEHIARHDPARVLADCESKRRVVELHIPDHECTDGSDSYPGVFSAWEPFQLCETLKLLALPYASHPDYRDEWRP